MYIAHSVKHGKVGAERTHMGWGQGDAIHGGLRLLGVGYGTGLEIYRPAHAKAGERGGDSIDPSPAPPSIDPSLCECWVEGGP